MSTKLLDHLKETKAFQRRAAEIRKNEPDITDDAIAARLTIPGLLEAAEQPTSGEERDAEVRLCCALQLVRDEKKFARTSALRWSADAIVEKLERGDRGIVALESERLRALAALAEHNDKPIEELIDEALDPDSIAELQGLSLVKEPLN